LPNLLGAIEDAEDHLLARYAAGGGHAEIDQPILDLGAEAAVLRLAPFGDVHAGQHLEHVDDRLAHRSAKGVGRLHDAVDAEADDRLVLGGLEVDVGGPVANRLVDHLLGRPRSLRALRPGNACRVFLALAGAFTDEAKGRAFLLFRLRACHLDAEVALHKAPEVVPTQDCVFLRDILIVEVRVGEAGHQVKEQQNDAGDPEPRQQPDDDQPDQPAAEQQQIPEQPGQLELFRVVIDPAARAHPREVDDQQDDELDGIEVETGAARKQAQQTR
jgi:hypothetical protein